MHHIQLKILRQLFLNASLGYAKLRPKGIESNHFAYHLEQLIKAGLISKLERKYTLSAEGLAFADRMSHADMTIRKQPHIVTTIHITNEAGHHVLFKHAFQPYLGMCGFIQGRTHYDEHIQQAATRELREKSGLDGIDLQHRGIAYIRAAKDDVRISAIVCHVFSGTAAGEPSLAAENPQKGTPFWGIPDKDHAVYMPGFWEVKQLLDTHDPKRLFFTEIETQL